MITPHFIVSQNDEFLFISVKIAHVRFSAKSIEMIVDSDVFIFSLSPYYLRLRFPYSVVDDERASAKYDSKSNCVEIKLPKDVKGQFFPDLDLSAKLLARKDELSKSKSEKPLIEELDVVNVISDDSQNTKPEELPKEGEALNWEISQSLSEEHGSDSVAYGFNNAYTQIIGLSVVNGNDINELGDPESCPETDRIIERLIKENIKFDPEYYAADYIMEKHPNIDDDKTFSHLLSWNSPTTTKFLSWYRKQQEASECERESYILVNFTEEEQEKMLNLPRKTYLVDPLYKPQLYVLLLTLLFAYQFDLRENEGDHTVESVWTIGKLIAQFSYLDSKLQITGDNESNYLKAAIVTGMRRSLCYPYHRNYALSLKAWTDVYYCLRGGKRFILKCLLDLRELFRFHDIYYVYDKIWLEDMCSWFLSNQVSENDTRRLAHDFKLELDKLRRSDITFEKADESSEEEDMVVLDIEEIEMMADESYNANETI